MYGPNWKPTGQPLLNVLYHGREFQNQSLKYNYKAKMITVKNISK